MRALIVDDHESVRTILQKFIAPYGETAVVHDGNEAIEAFHKAIEESVPYDLICLDIMMPNLDGHQVLAKIRDYESQVGIDEDRRVKVMMVTALDDKDNKLRAEVYGCETYICKPIHKKEFLAAMTRLGLIEE